jgi:hypothetical protein
MNAEGRKWFKGLLRAGVFTAKGLVLRGLLIGAAFAICEAAGFREHTTFLSGTAATAGGWNASVICGVIYIVAYLGCVVLAPVLMVAATLLVVWEKVRPRTPPVV